MEEVIPSISSNKTEARNEPPFFYYECYFRE